LNCQRAAAVALAALGFRRTLHFRADRDLVAFARNLNVVPDHTRNPGVHDVGIVAFHDIHPEHCGRHVGAHGPETAANDLVETGVGKRDLRCDVVHEISCECCGTGG
jgi:hypothetical protein